MFHKWRLKHRYREAQNEIRALVWKYPEAVGYVMARMERGEVGGHTYASCIYGCFGKALKSKGEDIRRFTCGDHGSSLTSLEKLTRPLLYGMTPENDVRMAIVREWFLGAVAEYEIHRSKMPPLPVVTHDKEM